MFVFPTPWPEQPVNELHLLIQPKHQTQWLWILGCALIANFLAGVLQLPLWLWGVGILFSTTLLWLVLSKSDFLKNPTHQQSARVFSLWVLFFIVSFLTTISWYFNIPPTTTEHSANIQAIIERPFKQNSWVATVISEDNHRLAIPYKVLLKLPFNTNFLKTKHLTPSTIINTPTEIEHPEKALFNGDFDYYHYLTLQGVSAIAKTKVDEIQLTNEKAGGGYSILNFAHTVREKIVDGFTQSIRDEKLAKLFASVVLGEQASNLDEETKSQFRTSGLSHLLAASGLNVGIVAGLVFMLGALLRFPLKMNLVLCIVTTSFYALVTGLPPSVIRATAMLLIALLLKLINRKLSPLLLLLISANCIGLVFPQLLQQIGFQLSFLTTLGIIIMAPPLQEKLGFYITQFASGIIVVPLVAQLWVTPLQWQLFGSLSTLAIIANIVVLPIIAVCTMVGFVAAILLLTFPILGQWLLWFFTPIIQLLLMIAGWFSALPFSQLYLNPIGEINTLLLYTLLVLGSIFLYTPLKLSLKKISVLVIGIFGFILSPFALAKLTSGFSSQSQLALFHHPQYSQTTNWVLALNTGATLVGIENTSLFELNRLKRYLKGQPINLLFLYPKALQNDDKKPSDLSLLLNQQNIDQIHAFTSANQNKNGVLFNAKEGSSQLDITKQALNFNLVRSGNIQIAQQDTLFFHQFCSTEQKCIHFYTGQVRDEQPFSPNEKNSLLLIQSFAQIPIQGVLINTEKQPQRFVSNRPMLEVHFELSPKQSTVVLNNN